MRISRKIISVLLSAALCMPVMQTGLAFGATQDEAALNANSAISKSAAKNSKKSAASIEKTAKAAEKLAASDKANKELSILPDQVIVTMRAGMSTAEATEELNALSADATLDVLSEGEGEGAIIKAKVPEGQSVADAIRKYSKLSGVETVEPNYVYSLIDDVSTSSKKVDEATNNKTNDASTLKTNSVTKKYSVTDPNVKTSSRFYQWYLERINAQRAWTLNRSEHKVTVAVMDTGINFEHADLKNNIDTTAARKFYHASSYVYVKIGGRYVRIKKTDSEGVKSEHYTTSETDRAYSHGAHVSGIIAAQANNGISFAGVSYNAQILPIKIFENIYDFNGKHEMKATDDVLIAAYDYLFRLKKNGRSDIKVVNLSLSALGHSSSSLEGVINLAKSKYGILTVCAAGNESSSAYSYPSDFESCISVIATDKNDEKASFSNYGKAKDISAPGVDIWSTDCGGTRMVSSRRGTSMAAPVVSGVAALVFAKKPSLKPDQVKNILYKTAIDINKGGWDQYTGWGIVDAEAALDAVGKSKVVNNYAKSLYGANADSTSNRIAEATYPKSSYAVLARMDNYHEAMCASGLAGQLKCPILLVNRKGFSKDTVKTLKKLKVKTVYVIGAKDVLPDKVVKTGLKAAGVKNGNFTRVEGSSPSSMSLKCAEVICKLKKNKKDKSRDKIIVTTPNSFQDALSMSSFAYRYGVPIIIQKSGKSSAQRTLSASAIKFINKEYKGATIYVPGGFGAVSWYSVEGVFEQHEVVRLGGQTAYDTSNKIAEYMVEEGFLDAKTAVVACGALRVKGVDALAGAALAGKKGGTIILVNENVGNEGYCAQGLNNFMKLHRHDMKKIYCLGGSYVMPQSMKKHIANVMRTYR